jgi:glutamyl-tRNA(Gln) amidotransferase subunit D
MPLSPMLMKKLEEASISTGDEITVTTAKGTFKGLLMPHSEFSGDDTLTIKLPSGYNVGVRIGSEDTVRLSRKGTEARRPSVHRELNTHLPRIAFVGTGGTIASFVDYRTGGVYPAIGAEEIVSLVPELQDICVMEGRTLFGIFSEDMFVEQWKKMAEEVAARLNEGYRGVLISHGTDTMGYTAAALSFMLHNLTGPVVLVGAQRSPDRPSFDGYLNLLSAARVAACSDIGEVAVVMHADISDRGCYVHRGTRVRKMHSSARDAFKSLNEGPLAFVDNEIHYLNDYRKKMSGETIADIEMSENASLIYFHPGMTAEQFLSVTDGAEGIVVAGTGLGHVSTEILKAVEMRCAEGVPVVITTQCLGGAVDLKVYARGRELLRAGAIPGGDMIPETAYIKLLYALAHFNSSEIREYMQRNVAGELSERRVFVH